MISAADAKPVSSIRFWSLGSMYEQVWKEGGRLAKKQLSIVLQFWWCRSRLWSVLIFDIQHRCQDQRRLWVCKMFKTWMNTDHFGSIINSSGNKFFFFVCYFIQTFSFFLCWIDIHWCWPPPIRRSYANQHSVWRVTFWSSHEPPTQSASLKKTYLSVGRRNLLMNEKQGGRCSCRLCYRIMGLRSYLWCVSVF